MKTSLKTINAAFESLSWVFDAKSRNYAKELLKLCEQEERGHRGFMDNFTLCHTSDTIGVKQAAKLFAVHRVAQYLTGTKFPVGQDYLHTQTSCFIAAGIADEFGKEVRAAWTKFDLVELAALDYCEYVKVRKDLDREPANA